MAAWPGSLPQDLRMQDYTESEGKSGMVRTEMDAGPDYTRRRFSSTPLNVQGSMILTLTQRATLETFYITTLGEGSDTIDWTHPITGASVTMRFRSRPTYSGVGTRFIAHLALEII